MAIPKKQLNLIVELMEALPSDGTEYKYHPTVLLIPHDEIYVGYFDTTIIDKMQKTGVIELLGIHDDDQQAIRIIERDDFLSSFAAGANEARNGNDLHYADYSNNQYAFSCGYEHWQNRNGKKKRPPAYDTNNEYVCHGFIMNAEGDLWKQN